MPDEDDLTPEEEAAILADFEELRDQYPTCALVWKLANSYTRLQKVQALGAPDLVVNNELELQKTTLEELCKALPTNEHGRYFLEDIAEHFQGELAFHPPKRRRG